MANQPTSRTTLPWHFGVAAAVIPGLVMLQSPFYTAIMGTRCATLLFVIGPLTLLGCGALWVHGLDDAGKGWRRFLFLAAFAGSMTMVGGSIADFARGFHEGWVAQGAGPILRQAATLDQLPPSAWSGLVDWVFLTVILGVLLHRIEKHRTDAARQRRLAAEAQEAVLRTKLAPHFIFNCLNTLKAQIASDPAGAEATTDRLASLFRQVVEVADRPTHALSEELRFVETYLGIEKARLGARLQVEIELPEALEACPVPPLSLQVLVENAVKHGIAPLEAGGTLRIAAERTGNVLTLRVEDPGPGISALSGTGTALATLRRRLARPEDLAFAMVAGRHCASLRWKV